MVLHPQARAQAEAWRGPGRRPFTVGTIEEARQTWREARAAAAGPTVEVEVVSTLAVGGVPARLYHPGGARLAPVVVYLHGGGWALGDLESSDDLCRHLAVSSGCALLSLDYRLAPEHPYPAALEDVGKALLWLDGRGPQIGVDPTRLALAGDGCGGHLAALSAARARDRGRPVAYQVLIHPALDPGPEFRRDREPAGLLPDAADMAFFWDTFLPPGTDRSAPQVAPLREDLAGMPPTLVITAENDILRDEAEAYGDALAEAGVPVACTRYRGLTHGFCRSFAVHGAAHAAAGQVGGVLREALLHDRSPVTAF